MPTSTGHHVHRRSGRPWDRGDAWDRGRTSCSERQMCVVSESDAELRFWGGSGKEAGRAGSQRCRQMVFRRISMSSDSTFRFSFGLWSGNCVCGLCSLRADWCTYWHQPWHPPPHLAPSAKVEWGSIWSQRGMGGKPEVASSGSVSRSSSWTETGAACYHSACHRLYKDREPRQQ